MPVHQDGILARPRSDTVIRRLLDQEIGEETIVSALEVATHGEPPDQSPSPMATLLAMLHDPVCAAADMSLPMMMRKAGVDLPTLLDAIRKTTVGLAIAASGHRVGRVLDGLGEAAEPKWVICERCEGEGEIADPMRADPDDPDADPVMRKCYAKEGGCDGTGKKRQHGDLDAAKLFLEAQGVRKSGGQSAPPINIDARQQVNVGGGKDARAADKQQSITTTVQNILENGG